MTTDTSQIRAPLRGFLNIDKPQGMTSFDVVRWVRRSARTKRVGHAGTLDPNATGVLPVAVGEATRLVDALVGARKRYHAELLLGRATDTYDIDGSVTAERDASGVTRADLEAVLAPFLGEIMQAPPAYSAVKRDGVPAYRAARRGEPLVLEARPVVVYSVDVLAFTPLEGGLMRADLDVACGRGFYVRSLAHEVGAALGVGGTLANLRRTQVGPFLAADATPLEAACRMLEAGAIEHLLHAPDAVLQQQPAVILGHEQVARARHGLPVAARPREGVAWPEVGAEARGYGPLGGLVASLTAGAEAGTWHPRRVFTDDTVSQPLPDAR